MRRMYSVDENREKIAQARAAVTPRLSLSTDVIVGFCGETEREFLATEALMRELRFDTVHLAAYSVRPGTAAARRPDDVPLVEKKRRLNHLLALQREIAAEQNRQYVGGVVEVLVEGSSDDGRLYGRTRENKVAWLPHGSARTGSLVRARVTEASAWQLHGEALDPAA
jgi:tRNA-2-methylthio-N6-dimethylallyladenosine synthase